METAERKLSTTPEQNDIAPGQITQLTDTVKNLVGAFSSGEYFLPETQANQDTPKTRKEMTARRRGFTRQPSGKTVTVQYDRASQEQKVIVTAQDAAGDKTGWHKYEEFVFDIGPDGGYTPHYTTGSIKQMPNGLLQRELASEPVTPDQVHDGFDRVQGYVANIVEKRNPPTHVPDVLKKAARVISRPFTPPGRGRHAA